MQEFNKNMGPKDQVVRIVLGISFSITALYLPLSTAWTITLFVIAAILFLTAAVAYCPLYTLLGRSTSKREEL
jgi:amino acid transporter